MRIETRVRIVRDDGSLLAEHESQETTTAAVEQGVITTLEASKLLREVDDMARHTVLAVATDLASRVGIRKALRRPRH